MLIVNSGTALAGPIRTFADLSAAILDLAEGSEDFIEAPENQLDPDATLAEIRSLRIRIEEQIRTEIEGLEDAVLEFIINNSEEAVPGIGQAAYANMFPSAVFPLGTSDLLTFQFLDPTTRQFTDGPDIDFVLYETFPDPGDPTLTVELGTSFDSSTDFAFEFAITDFEHVILATSFDSTGDPLFLPGIDGGNVAQSMIMVFQDIEIPAPEPSTIALFSIGLVGLGFIACRGRKTALPA